MRSKGSRIEAVLLAAVVVLGLSHVLGAPRAAAQQAGGQQMFAVVAPGQGQGSNVLFVIDPAGGRLMVYEHQTRGKLELVAVRDITNEAQFQEWNVPNAAARAQQPSVGDIIKELNKLQGGQRGG